jgi:hypothetical protein
MGGLLFCAERSRSELKRIPLRRFFAWAFVGTRHAHTEAPAVAAAPKDYSEEHRIGAVALLDLLSLLVFIPAVRAFAMASSQPSLLPPPNPHSSPLPALIECDGVFKDFLDMGLRYHLLVSTLRVCLGAFRCAWATASSAWHSDRKVLDTLRSGTFPDGLVATAHASVEIGWNPL